MNWYEPEKVTKYSKNSTNKGNFLKIKVIKTRLKKGETENGTKKTNKLKCKN